MLTFGLRGGGLREDSSSPPSFSCTTGTKGYCYAVSSPRTDAEFRALQQQLNQIAPWASYATITVDGKIGNDVLDRAQRATNWARTVPQTQSWAIALSQNVGSKESIARTIYGTNGLLQNLIAAVPTSAKTGKLVATTPPPVAPPGSYPPSPPIIDPATGLVQPTSSGTRWPYYAAGAIGGLAILYAAFHMSKNYKATPALPASAW